MWGIEVVHWLCGNALQCTSISTRVVCLRILPWRGECGIGRGCMWIPSSMDDTKWSFFYPCWGSSALISAHCVDFVDVDHGLNRYYQMPSPSLHIYFERQWKDSCAVLQRKFRKVALHLFLTLKILALSCMARRGAWVEELHDESRWHTPTSC